MAKSAKKSVQSADASLETKAVATATSGISVPEDWLFQLFGSVPATAGPAVTPASAMSVPAVKACVELISGAIGSLPVKIYREAPEGGRQEAQDHPAFDLVHDDANDWTSAGKLRAQLVTDALLRGNGYGLVRRDDQGEPFEVLRLDPEAVAIERDLATGEPWFRLSTGAGQDVIPHADMIHIPAPASLDGITGIAPIARARDAISLALALEQHASRIMRKGARPSGIIVAPNVVSPDSALKLRTSFTAQNANENSGGVAVLYGSATFTPTEFKSVDQQFMEQRIFQIHEICKIFNVPPTMIGELAKATLSNSETMGRQFLQLTLMPWIVTIRDAYRRAFIPRSERRTYSIDFVVDGLLQADSVQRAAFWSAMRSGGIITANEIRRMENFPARPDGDSLASPHTTANVSPEAANDE